MIQIHESRRKIKFVHIDYPRLAVGYVDLDSGKFIFNYGIFSGTYKFDELKEDFILEAFGANMGGGIIRMCKALHEGKALTTELITELGIKDDERHIEYFEDEE